MDGGDPGTLCLRFVSGRAKDGKSISIARSHAMKAYRSRQRSEKRRGDAKARSLLPKSVRAEAPTSLVHAFSQASLDPFHTTAILPRQLIDYAHGLDEVKAHALTFCPMRSVVFPVAVQHPALLAGLLYVSYAHLSSLRGRSDPELVLRLKGATISEINRELTQRGTATCTSLIAAVSYLIMGTWVLDSTSDEVDAHLRGLKAMVSHRSMQSLGVYTFGQTFRKLLSLQHTVMAGVMAQPLSPVFDLELPDTSQAMLDEQLRQLSMRRLTPQLPQKDVEELCQAIQAIESLFGLCIEDLRLSTTTSNFLTQLLELVNQPSKEDASNSSSQLSGLFDSQFTASQILAEAVLNRTPLSTTNPLRIAHLFELLRKLNPPPSESPFQLLLLFALMIGTTAAGGQRGPNQLHCMLSATISAIASSDENFYLGLWMTQQFARIQTAIFRERQN